MRLLIFILLFSLQASGQFVFPAVMSTPGETPPAPITGTRTLISDDFDGSTLNSRWNVRRPDKQTITVSGGEASVQVSTDTMPQRTGYSWSNLTTQCMIYDTSYGLTCIRNYTIEVGFKINKLNDTTLGVFVGAYSPINLDYYFSNFTHVQFSSPDTLRILSGKDTAYTFPPSGHQQITFTFNTTDDYLLRHRVFEDYTVQIIKNVTTGDSIVRYQQYSFTNGVWPMRPNYFYFAFGAMGRSDVSFQYYTVTTTEELNPKYLFVGNSITTGYNATKADSAYANILKRSTNDSIQIWAGGGMGIDEVQLTMNRLGEVNPQYVFLNIGTNNTFNAGFYTKYAALVDTLENRGYTVYPCLIVNGGDPVSGAGWNKWIKDTYPSTYLDLWTAGWSTMTVGNGEMYDSVHPNLAGHQKLAALIKTLKPLLFPL